MSNGTDHNESGILSSDLPRVNRNPLLDDFQVVVSAGYLFRDGRPRYTVGRGFSELEADELAERMNARDDAEDRLKEFLDRMTTISQERIQAAEAKR